MGVGVGEVIGAGIGISVKICVGGVSVGMTCFDANEHASIMTIVVKKQASINLLISRSPPFQRSFISKN